MNFSEQLNSGLDMVLEEKKKPQLTEKQIQTDIMDYLRILGASADVTTMGYYGNNGMADIVGCFEGKYFAIEVKRPGNYPTPLQKKWLEEKRKAGAVAFIATSVNDVKLNMLNLIYLED